MEEIGQPRQVTARQLGQMLVLVPVMIHWLRDAGPEAGSLLVKDVTVDGPAVQHILHRILDALNFSGDLTIAQVKELGESVGDKVWAAAIRKIVIDSEPSLIPPSIGSELVKHVGDVSLAKQALDRLTRTQFYALGELCALFHDCGDADLAALVGSRIVVHTGHNLNGSSETSTNVMKQLINQCDLLFGRAGGATGRSQKALGGQSGTRESTLAANQASQLPVVSVQDALLNARKHALKAFFQWKDESKVESVDELFENHSFVDIARGVWERYDVLPGGWRGELEEMRDRGVEEAAWVPPEGQPLSTVIHPPQISSSTVAATIPQDVGPKANRRTLVGFGRPSKTSIVEASPAFSNLNLLINEIVDSEIFYYSVLKELQDTYVSELREIASGTRGSEAQTALGISQNDVESVFGWRLAQVVETSKNLLAKLEVINLVRHEVRHPGGRAMFVANAFAAIAPSLSVNYAPFVSGHRHGMNVLNGGRRPLSHRGGGGDGRPQSLRFTTMIGSRFSSRSLLTLANGSNVGNQNSFVAIWENLTANSKRLKGQSLQSIMIMPIQRIPRYKLLLAELEKKLPADHLCRPVLGTALAQVSSVAQQINQALRQHEKLENLVGAGDMPEIAGAKSTVKNGSMRLTVNYKASNAS